MRSRGPVDASSERFIQEIHHRVKNNLQTVASLLRLQMRRTKSLEAKEVLLEGINRVMSIAVLHDLLALENEDSVVFSVLVERLSAENLKHLMPGQTVVTSFDNCSCRVPAHQASSLALALNELILNSVKHAFRANMRGELSISSTCSDGVLTIVFGDNGPGLPPAFSPAISGNLGLQLVTSIVRENLHGEISFANANGAVIRISFPVDEDL